MAAIDDLSLPQGWTKTARSSVLHAISIDIGHRAWASTKARHVPAEM